MGRPRKPTQLLKLSGALKRNPGRYRDRLNEPVSAGPVGDPPERLPPVEVAAWREIEAMAPAGVLRQADRWLLEITAGLLAKSRANGGLVTGERTQLLLCLSKMGLTPADRSRVAVAEPECHNPFSEFETR